MSNAQRYVTESLAASGLAVIAGQVACTLRPDLWSSGTSAGADLARLRTDYLVGVGRYKILFDGLNRPVEVLARSDDRLAVRLEWLVGMQVLEIGEVEAGKVSASAPIQTAARAPTVDPNGDRYAEIATANPGRACTDCVNLMLNGRCRAFEKSGLEWPSPNTLRRCLQLVPEYGTMDDRTGAQLWPELAKVRAKTEGAAS